MRCYESLRARRAWSLPSPRLNEVGDARPPAAALAEGGVGPDEGLAIGGATGMDELAADGEGDVMEDLIMGEKSGGCPREKHHIGCFSRGQG